MKPVYMAGIYHTIRVYRLPWVARSLLPATSLARPPQREERRDRPLPLGRFLSGALLTSKNDGCLRAGLGEGAEEVSPSLTREAGDPKEDVILLISVDIRDGLYGCPEVV